MEECLKKLKSKVVVGLVGGSDAVKITEQVGGDMSSKYALQNYKEKLASLLNNQNGVIYNFEEGHYLFQYWHWINLLKFPT